MYIYIYREAIIGYYLGCLVLSLVSDVSGGWDYIVPVEHTLPTFQLPHLHLAGSNQWVGRLPSTATVGST